MSALGLEPDTTRIRELIQALEVDRRQLLALDEAEALSAAGQGGAALRLVAEALKDNPRHSALNVLQRRLEQSQRQSVVAAVKKGLAETRPISLDFREAGLRQVLDIVSRNSGVNFILDKDIRADLRVTIYLQSATVEDALDLIVSTHQLSKKVLDSRTVLIYPNTPEKQREFQEQVLKVFYLASAEAKGAAAFLRSMLKVKEPFVDERSNMLALREPPEIIQLAERLMALYDAQEPEVMLELEVLEIRSTRLTELGIQFPSSIGLTALPPAGAAGLTVANIRSLNSERLGVTPLSVLLNLRREVGDFEVLANPRIRAKNKEKARVLIGTRLPIVTTTTGQAGFVSDNITYLDVGLKLDMESQISADDDVAIKLSLEVSSLSNQVRTPSGSLAYEISTRNASTALKLHDGETQVLAGLVSREERSSANRIPGLGDIPAVGRLFSSQLDDGQRTELVLAITPRILRNIRRPDVSETELWVGTESYTRLRSVGGRAPEAQPDSAAARPGAAAGPPGQGAPTGPRPPAGANVLAPSPSGTSHLPTAVVPTAPPSPAALPVVPTVQLRAPAEVKLGSEFDVEVTLATRLPLRGLTLRGKIDLQRVSLVAVSAGSLFQAGGMASVSQSVDAAGSGFQATTLRTQGDASPGAGVAMTLRFKALQAGPIEIDELQVEAAPAQPGSPAITAPPAQRVEVKP